MRIKKMLSIMLAIVMLACSTIAIAPNAYSATAKGSISAVSNTASGIKVTWTKDSTKTGYYIYRKVGTEKSFKKVKQITKNSTLSWTDTSVSNGKKYVYKVRSYKGSKITTNNTTKTIYRVSKPTPTVSRSSSTAITVKASNANATGFQIKYSKNSNMSSAKTLTVAGTSLNYKITGLEKATKYYVQVRAYKTVSGTKYYSVYSDVKNVVTYFTAYTTNMYTTLYTKADTSSSSISIRYMNQITVYDVAKTYSNGKYYQKVKYNGSYYYIFLQPNEIKFTATKNPYDFSNIATNEYAQKMVDKAVDIFKNKKTKYPVTGDKDKNWQTINGVLYVDCSGFLSYVLDNVFSSKIPCYSVSQNVEKLCYTDVMYNYQLPNEFKPTVVYDKYKGTSFSFDMLEAGDFIFYDMPPKDVGSNKSPNHVVMFLTKDFFIHSTQSADGVEVLPFTNNFAETSRIKRVVRFAPDEIKLANVKATVNNKEVNPDTGNIYKTIKIYKNDDSKEAIATMTKGDEVTIISANYYYAYVNYNGTKGYVYLGKDTVKERGIKYRFDLA